MRPIPLNALALAAAFGAIATGAGAQNAQPKNEPHNALIRHAKELGLQTTWSADMTITAMSLALTGKIWQDGETSRVDTTMPVLNMKLSVIQTTRDGKPVSISLFHASKKYVVKPRTETTGAADAGSLVITDLGKEKFNNEDCVKKRLSTKDNAETASIVLFAPSQKNMPVKMTMETVPGQGEDARAEVTFTNYDFKKPGADVFAIPAGYTEAANEQEALRGGGGLLGMLLDAQEEDGETVAEDGDAEEEDEEEIENTLKALKEDLKEGLKDAAVNEGVNALRRGLFGR